MRMSSSGTWSGRPPRRCRPSTSWRTRSRRTWPRVGIRLRVLAGVSKGTPRGDYGRAAEERGGRRGLRVEIPSNGFRRLQLRRLHVGTGGLPGPLLSAPSPRGPARTGSGRWRRWCSRRTSYGHPTDGVEDAVEAHHRAGPARAEYLKEYGARDEQRRVRPESDQRHPRITQARPPRPEVVQRHGDQQAEPEAVLADRHVEGVERQEPDRGPV